MFNVVIQEHLLKFFQLRPMISLISLLALAVIFIFISKKTTFNAQILSYGAISIAIAFVLSFVKVLSLPYGGTITIASMLPIFIFSYIAGPGAGMTAGLCYGLLQYIQEPYFVHPAQFILDYPLAFALLGLAGFFKHNVYLGSILGGFARLICHFLSGVIFFGSYAPEGQNVFLYSFMYNISYILPDLLICLGLLMISNVRSAISRIRIARI